MHQQVLAGANSRLKIKDGGRTFKLALLSALPPKAPDTLVCIIASLRMIVAKAQPLQLRFCTAETWGRKLTAPAH